MKAMTIKMYVQYNSCSWYGCRIREIIFFGVTFCFQLNDHELVPDLLYIYPLVCDVTIQ